MRRLFQPFRKTESHRPGPCGRPGQTDQGPRSNHRSRSRQRSPECPRRWHPKAAPSLRIRCRPGREPGRRSGRDSPEPRRRPRPPGRHHPPRRRRKMKNRHHRTQAATKLLQNLLRTPTSLRPARLNLQRSRQKRICPEAGQTGRRNRPPTPRRRPRSRPDRRRRAKRPAHQRLPFRISRIRPSRAGLPLRRRTRPPRSAR